MTDELPAAVRSFIDRRIQGFEQLEVLLFLHREAAKFWDASGVAQALHLSDTRVASHLEALASRGLLDVRIASAMKYRFSPATRALADAVDQVAAAYVDHRSELLEAVASRRPSLKDFSDAFRFTQEDEDDDG